mmetsp:Transcript_19751/g.31526  ORF Transcript_19751/g.31526 Transcript_19751/m.31526 type:complete len:359 (-) Transcript_19751:51-1127(-)
MDGNTPLLQDEAEEAVPAPQAGRVAPLSRLARRAPDQESYALLQESSEQDARVDLVQGGTSSSLGGGGVLQFFECEEAGARAEPKERLLAARLAAQPVGDAEPSAGFVAIEMRSMSQEMDKSREPLPVVSASCGASSALEGDDRNCFICLQDADKDNSLISCCSTCFACTHVRCWREWRSNQHRTALRSRLLGLRMQTNHMLRCTICKSGTAMVAGEENGLDWMNELMCGGEPSQNSLLGRLAAVGARREDSDEDPDAQLEDLVDSRTCVALVIYLVLLVVVLMVACLLIVMQWFYAGDVVLCSIIALYELSVLQLVVLALLRRRGSILAAIDSRIGGSTGTLASAASNPREVELTSV